MRVSIFSTNFVWNISHFNRNWGRKYPLRLSDLNKTYIFSTEFGKILKYQIPHNSIQWKPADGQTDTTKLIVVFRNFTIASKKWQFKRKFNIAVNLNYHQKEKKSTAFACLTSVIRFWKSDALNGNAKREPFPIILNRKNYNAFQSQPKPPPPTIFLKRD
jgi:hypothetical protein